MSRRRFSLSSFRPDAAAALTGPEWLRARRAAAAARAADLSLPTEAEEIWRYSRISELDLDAYAPFEGSAPPLETIPAELSATVTTSRGHAALVLVHNGKVVRAEVDPAMARRGLTVADVADLDDGDDLLGGTAPPSADLFGELNAAFMPGAAVVAVPAGLEVAAPVLVLHWFDGEGLDGRPMAAFPRTIVSAGPDSDVTVIEHQASADVVALVVPVVDLRLAQAARAHYFNLQDLGPRVWQVGHQASAVGRDASLRSSVVALGGDYARVRTDSRIVGQGGSSELTAVYFADGDRMHDFRTLQDHAAPSSTSDLLFKGAVQDRGRSVYSGLIRVRKEAQGTNAFQTNRNLVLSEGAHADSVPNLEIEANDVRCSHASAVGPIDEDQRYYLESRGIPPREAERLIVLGFFGEVLDRLPVPELAGALRTAVTARLAVRRP